MRYLPTATTNEYSHEYPDSFPNGLQLFLPIANTTVSAILTVNGVMMMMMMVVVVEVFRS
jgi:hypothetical protein